MSPVENPPVSNQALKLTYRVGGFAAMAMVVITLSQFVVFIVAPPPLEGTAINWFDLFQENRLAGLLSFELLLVIYVLLAIPLSISLFTALGKSNQWLTSVYVVVTIVGTVLFVSSRPALEMLQLSDYYAAATTDEAKAAFLAAGEAMVATFHGTAFQVSYLLGSLGGILLSSAMLRDGSFTRATAYLRLASSILDLGIYIPQIGLYISLLSVFCLLGFHGLIARRLFLLRHE